MCTGDGSYDGQPEARTVSSKVRRVETVKDLGQIFRGNAGAVIDYMKTKIPGIGGFFDHHTDRR
jgi:hypothetical protein